MTATSKLAISSYDLKNYMYFGHLLMLITFMVIYNTSYAQLAN